jgi:hypothetical protein
MPGASTLTYRTHTLSIIRQWGFMNTASETFWHKTVLGQTHSILTDKKQSYRQKTFWHTNSILTVKNNPDRRKALLQTKKHSDRQKTFLQTRNILTEKKRSERQKAFWETKSVLIDSISTKKKYYNRPEAFWQTKEFQQKFSISTDQKHSDR